jgi:hypothetical protein
MSYVVPSIGNGCGVQWQGLFGLPKDARVSSEGFTPAVLIVVVALYRDSRSLKVLIAPDELSTYLFPRR